MAAAAAALLGGGLEQENWDGFKAQALRQVERVGLGSWFKDLLAQP